MDREIIFLLKSIMKRSFYTIDDAQTETESTKRQITYRLEKVNQLVDEVGLLPITIGTQKEFLIDVKTKDYLINYLFESNENISYQLSSDERKIYIYLCMFVNRDYLSIQHFISDLDVSKSTIIQDINDLGVDLLKHDISLDYDRMNGYSINGKEMELRRYMMKLVISALYDNSNSHVFDMFIDSLHLYTFDFSRLIIQELAQKHGISFVENRLTDFIYIFIILIARIVNGKNIDHHNNDIPDIEMMKTFKEYDFTEELINFFPFRDQIGSLDRKYIASWVLGISFGNVDDDSEDSLIIAQMVGKIMKRFELLSGIHYSNAIGIFRNLYAHFRPAYYRILFRLPIINPLKDRIMSEYPSHYSLVKETMKPFINTFGDEIGDDELAYLTIHFASIFTEEYEEVEIDKHRALIVCLNGIGSSIILYNELRNLFPNIEFLPPVEISQINTEEYDVDIVFTTDMFKELHHIDVPVVKVNPIMDETERYNVYREVLFLLGNINTPKVREKELTDILRKHLGQVENEDLIIKDLINAYSRINITNKEKNDCDTCLYDMVDESLIKLKVDAKTPEDVLTIAGELLIERGAITHNYLLDVLRLYQQTPSYFLIAPHILLPHTKPEKGALDRALSIVTLKNPLHFGDSENNPVKYVFFLSATDNSSHVSAMGEFSNLMNNPKFMALLENAKNPQDILEFIENNQ